MPKKNSSKGQDFAAMIAALIVIAVAVASLIYSMVKAEPEDVQGILVEEIDGVPYLNPGNGLATPDAPPNLEAPTEAPQS